MKFLDNPPPKKRNWMSFAHDPYVYQHFSIEFFKIFFFLIHSFAPFHNKNGSYFSFLPGLCRTMEFKYEGDSVYNGVPISVYNTNFGDVKVV